MNFDARDLIEVNQALLHQAAALAEPSPAVLVAVATWGRGADPKLLAALQPYRIGLGFNGSVVARLPWDVAEDILPETVRAQLSAQDDTTRISVCGAVFKDWLVEIWDLV
jgi:hypothetical protein